MWFRSKKPPEVVETVQLHDVMKAITTLRAQYAELEEGLAALKAQHLKLRGRVFARWGREGEEGESPTPRPQSREELKKQLTLTGRFIPGRPAHHSE